MNQHSIGWGIGYPQSKREASIVDFPSQKQTIKKE
jgi:hypothetical protein